MRNLAPLLNAKKEFQILVNEYPNSDFALDEKYKLQLIEDRLAGKEMYIGRHYAKSKKWIDLRSTGDGCVYLTHKSTQSLIEAMTTENSRGSCQQEGAIESGFIEYGYAVCAATGAQWVHDHLRFGESNIIQSIQSIRYGQMNFPKMEVIA